MSSRRCEDVVVSTLCPLMGRALTRTQPDDVCSRRDGSELCSSDDVFGERG
jgi:hypothetical protein